MSYRYPQQTYALYPTPHWPEDVKSALPEEDQDDRGLDASSLADVTDSRRHSTVKLEDEYHSAQMWHDRPHSQMAQMRHYSHPTVPTLNTAHPGVRLPEHGYGGYGPAQPWTMPSHSESSTPTPLFGPVQDPMPVQFTPASASYAYQAPEPPSAISMSPQSSQGGWASANSSDGAELKAEPTSPYNRPMSPMTVLRSDGMRKKNARFEIPKDRNLLTIDAMIMEATDDSLKKELKSQKRLLRNRQAALDSRQRKKTHTEALEMEKKTFDVQKQEMEEVMANLENQMAHEREQWMQQRQQYEAFIQQVQYERDEAIRTKTLETGELRRQNNVLKDCVRELERQHATRGFQPSDSEPFQSDFSNFSGLDLDDSWDDEPFNLIGDDLEMKGEDTPHRQLTPRPPPPPADTKLSKQDTLISMNTFYMCLLFGAFFTSTFTNKDANASTSTAALSALPEDYKAEADNMLKVLASNQDADVLATPQHSALPTTISGHELSRMTNQPPTTGPSSSLDTLAHTLTNPTRRQSAAAAFSLSESSFNHITNPDGIMNTPSPPASNTPSASASSTAVGGGEERQPTRLESLFRSIQESRDDLDRMSGMGGKARERSVLLDRVPEKVLRDFREMVGRVREEEKRGS